MNANILQMLLWILFCINFSVIKVSFADPTTSKRICDQCLNADKLPIPQNDLCERDTDCAITYKAWNINGHCISGYESTVIDLTFRDLTEYCLLMAPSSHASNISCADSADPSEKFYTKLFEGNDTIMDYLTEVYSYRKNEFWVPVKRIYDTYVLPISGNNVKINNSISKSAWDLKMNEKYVKIKYENNKWVSIDSYDGAGNYPTLCVYEKESVYVEQFHCDENWFTTSFRKMQHRCFSEQKFNKILPPNSHLVTIDSADVNYLVKFTKYLVDNVAVNYVPGYDKDDFQFRVDLWRDYAKQANFTNWSMETGIPNVTTPLYGYVLSNGRWVIRNTEPSRDSYMLVEKTMGFKMPTLKLSYNEKTDEIEVTITNAEYIYKHAKNVLPVNCYPVNSLDFLEGSQFELSHTPHNASYWPLKFLYHFVGIREYECEGRAVFTFQPIKSNRLKIIRNMNTTDNIFVITVKEKCNFENIRKNSTFLQEIDNGISTYLVNTYDIVLKSLDMLQIVSFDQGSGDFVAIYHLVSSTPSDMTSLQTFNKINEQLLTMVEDVETHYEIDIDILEMRNLLKCVSNDDDFDEVSVGQISRSKSFCLVEDGSYASKKCIANDIYGAAWDITGDFECIEDLPLLYFYNLTQIDAEDFIQNSNNTIHQVIETTLDKPVTITLVADIMGKMSQSITIESRFQKGNATKSVEKNSINSCTALVNHVMNTDAEVLKSAAEKSNSTNELLVGFDTAINNLALRIEFNTTRISNITNGTSPKTEDDDDAVFIDTKPNVMIIIVNPWIKNISGIALYSKPKKTSQSFFNYNVLKIKDDPDRNLDALYNDTLEIGAIVPLSTLRKMENGDKHRRPSRVVFIIYSADALFVEDKKNLTQSKSTTFIDGKVIRISVPDYGDILPGGFITFFKEHEENHGTASNCSAWGMDGTGWESEDNKTTKRNNKIVTCKPIKQANYGLMMLFGSTNTGDHGGINKNFHVALHVITIIGCNLSIAGALLVLVTGCIFAHFRRRPGSKLVFHICTANVLLFTALQVSQTEAIRDTLCLASSIVLHLFVLVLFCLTLLALNIQYLKYVVVYGPSIPKHFDAKLWIIGWIVPMLIVINSVIYDLKAYTANEEMFKLMTQNIIMDSEDVNQNRICYPTGAVVKYAVHLPLSIIILVNLVVYVYIIYSVNRGQSVTIGKSVTKSNISHQLRLYSYSFYMLALSWLFGLVAQHADKFPVIFIISSTIFVLTATFQGFIILLYCMCFDKETRNAWIGLIQGDKRRRY